MSRPDELAERKARLIAQADLQRMQALLAWEMARSIVAPPAPEGRSRRSHAVAATLIGFSLPFFGAGRMRRVVRAISIGITVLRAFSRVARWQALNRKTAAPRLRVRVRASARRSSI